MKSNARKINANEVASRIEDFLMDIHHAGELSSAQLRKKNTYRSVLRAINHADRVVCRDLVVETLVVFYIPPSTNNIPFDLQEHYTGDLIDEINSLGLSNPQNGYFLAKQDHLNILDINDRYIHIYDDYPTGAEKSSKKIKKVNRSEFLNTEDKVEPYSYYVNLQNTDYELENQCMFIPDDNRLILGDTFDTGKFGRFNGRIMPGVVNTDSIPDGKIDECDYNAYKVWTPHYALEYLMYEALLYLMPITPTNSRISISNERNREKNLIQKMKPEEHNVIVPKFSY